MGDVRTAVKGTVSEQVGVLAQQIDDLIVQKKDDLQREGTAQHDRNIRAIALLDATKGYLKAVKDSLDRTRRPGQITAVPRCALSWAGATADRGRHGR